MKTKHYLIPVLSPYKNIGAIRREESAIDHIFFYTHNEDYSVISNSDGTFSKNILEEGPVTDEELQKYFKS
jgi:hypothetical protein